MVSGLIERVGLAHGGSGRDGGVVVVELLQAEHLLFEAQQPVERPQVGADGGNQVVIDLRADVVFEQVGLQAGGELIYFGEGHLLAHLAIQQRGEGVLIGAHILPIGFHHGAAVFGHRGNAVLHEAHLIEFHLGPVAERDFGRRHVHVVEQVGDLDRGLGPQVELGDDRFLGFGEGVGAVAQGLFQQEPVGLEARFGAQVFGHLVIAQRQDARGDEGTLRAEPRRKPLNLAEQRGGLRIGEIHVVLQLRVGIEPFGALVEQVDQIERVGEFRGAGGPVLGGIAELGGVGLERVKLGPPGGVVLEQVGQVEFILVRDLGPLGHGVVGDFGSGGLVGGGRHTGANQRGNGQNRAEDGHAPRIKPIWHAWQPKSPPKSPPNAGSGVAPHLR